MAITLDLDNDELASLFFYLQLNDKFLEDPLMEKLIIKMESIIYSRFSIDEIEKYRNKVLNDKIAGEFK